MAFLRKEESRPVCACSGVPAGPAGTRRYLLDSRLCGNDTLGLARQGRGRLLHSAKMLLTQTVNGNAGFGYNLLQNKELFAFSRQIDPFGSRGPNRRLSAGFCRG